VHVTAISRARPCRALTRRTTASEQPTSKHASFRVGELRDQTDASSAISWSRGLTEPAQNGFRAGLIGTRVDPALTGLLPQVAMVAAAWAGTFALDMTLIPAVHGCVQDRLFHGCLVGSDPSAALATMSLRIGELLIRKWR
jgi:hypothetical protein